MRSIKTRHDKRGAYTYVDALGAKRIVKAGDVDPDTGYALIEEDIKRLHRMDDNEVYNNVKNAKKPVESWERPILEAWKEAHPNEALPSRGFVSIDAIAACQDEEGGGDADKSAVMAGLAYWEQERVSPEIERLREVVEMLRSDQRELYRRIVLEGELAVSVAAELGVDKSTITRRMNSIKKFIRKNF